MSGSTTTEIASTAALFRQSASYPERPVEIEEIETHISHVFLTPRFAYKLKKPVRFEFLDFSTPELRREACENEVRLNRRLARDVYQGVLPVTRSAQGTLSLNGDGTPVDWVVKMRRLPATRTLYHLIVTDQLLPRDIRVLGDTLSNFYVQQPPLMVQPDAYRRRLREHIRANWSDLLESLPDRIETINRVHSAMLRFLTLRPGSLDRRVCDGLVIEGHGDLRPEHVFFTSPLAIIDCIEFSTELREVDVADELCFLGMECDRLGKPEVFRSVMARYSEATGDRPDRSIIAFYKTYRACVRAKVSALQGVQASSALRPHHLGLAQRYLQLASDYLPDVGPRLVIAVTGLMGTGKSTLASALADALGGELLQTDELRRRRYGRSAVRLNYGLGHYQPRFRDVVYGDLLDAAKKQLEKGGSVILDGTFSKESHRASMLELARQHNATGIMLRCECPREVALGRIQRRSWPNSHGSEAHPQLFDQQVAEFEPDANGHPMLKIDTRQPLDHQVDAVLDFVKARLNS